MGTESMGAGNREQGTGSRDIKQGTGTREQRAGKQGAQDRNQGTVRIQAAEPDNRKQGTRNWVAPGRAFLFG